MLDTRIDLVALQVCLLEQLFVEQERTWTVEHEKENKCPACEHREAPASPTSPTSPTRVAPQSPKLRRHWPAHRRFWHRSPREWREEHAEQEVQS
jgi:hypothetical protein